MLFPVIVHKDANSDYGVIIPDFPGVFSGGATLEEALENAQDALVTRFCDDEECILPHPSSLEDALSCPDSKDGAVIMVDFDPEAFATGQATSHIILPLKLKRNIDNAANSLGLTSSEYLEKAVQDYQKN